MKECEEGIVQVAKKIGRVLNRPFPYIRKVIFLGI